MPRLPWSVAIVLASLSACLAHEDDGTTAAREPASERQRKAEPKAPSEPTPTLLGDDPIEASEEPPASEPDDPDDPDDRDAPIAQPSAGRPPDGASLPIDGEIARQALAHGEAGEAEKMRAEWLRLIRDHPQSVYVPLAYTAFGEHYFAQRDFEAASKLYEKATQFRDSPVRAWALYKHAWCKLELGDGAGALAGFVQTLSAIADGHAGNQADAETLAAAARRDLVIAYAIVGKPDKAAPFFQRLGKGTAADEVPPAKMLDLLGRRLTKSGQSAEASVVCEALKSSDPRSTCAW